MRKCAILSLLTFTVLIALIPCATAVASTTYSTHVVADSATRKTSPRALGSWAVWSEQTNSEYPITGFEPRWLYFYDATTRQTLCVASGPVDSQYDIGPGFIAYAEVPEYGGQRWIKLFDISSGEGSDVASATTLGGLACGDGFVAWADGDVHIYDVRTGIETTRTGSSVYQTFDADGREVVWIEPPGEPTGATRVHALNVVTGVRRSTVIPSFTPGACSVSSAGVLIEGESSTYREALYLWNPDSGRSVKLVGVNDAYHHISGARLSSRFVAWGQHSSSEYPGTRIAVMDLSTGSWELVYPFVDKAFVGDVVGNRVWFTGARSDDSGASIGYVDIIETVSPSSGSGSHGGTWTALDEADAESETVDASATAAATGTPDPADDGSAVVSGALSPTVMPAEPDRTRTTPWLAVAVVAGLSLAGGGAWLVRQRAR